MNKLWKILITIILVAITLGVLTRAVLFGYFAFNPEARTQLQAPLLHERFSSLQDMNPEDNPAFERPGALPTVRAMRFNRLYPFGMRSAVYSFHRPFGLLPLLIVLVGIFFLGRYVGKKGVSIKIDKDETNTSS